MLRVLVLFFLSLTLWGDLDSQMARSKTVGDQAVSLIPEEWRVLLQDWELIFVPRVKNILARMWCKEKRIFVFVRQTQSPKDVAFVLAHEIGHVLSHNKMKEERRKEWVKMRDLRLPTMQWFECKDCKKGDSPEEDFAESVSHVIYPHKKNKFRSKLGPPPNEEQRKFILDLLAAP